MLMAHASHCTSCDVHCAIGTRNCEDTVLVHHDIRSWHGCWTEELATSTLSFSTCFHLSLLWPLFLQGNGCSA